MDEERKKELKEKMLSIVNLIEQGTNQISVENVTFYKDFEFNGSGLGEYNVFLAKIQNSKDNTTTYEIYSEKLNSLIATVNEQGKLHFMPEYLEKLREGNEEYFETLMLEDLDFELPEEEKALLNEKDNTILSKKDNISLKSEEKEQNSLTLTKEEIEESKNKKTLETVKETLGENELEAYSEMNTNQTPLFDKITNKQEIDPNVKVTATATLADMIPEIKEKGFVKIGIAYSNSKSSNCGRFTFLGVTQEGEIEPIESLQNIEGTSTGQKITSINSSNGSLIETEQVGGLTKLPGGNEEYISVKQGQYGTFEVDYVRRQLSENKEEAYFSAPIETHNIKPTTREVKELMDRHHNTRIDDELKKAKPELSRDGETRIENIDDTASNDKLGIDDIIVLEDGTETTIRNEAQKDKVSPEEFLSKYERTGGKTPSEIIESVHEEIEEEYIGGNKEI